MSENLKRPKETGQRSSEAGDAQRRGDKYYSKVVGKALDILELIRRSQTPLSLNRLTQHVGMAKSSVFRILHTLEVCGYIKRNDSGHYLLSIQVRPWVSRYFVDELIEVATPRMWELRRKYGETVSVGVLFDNHIEVVAVCESPQLIRMANTVGRIVPPHASSLGKAIAAFQSEPRREALLRSYGLHRFTEETITDELQLKLEFEKIREEGYGCDAEESTKLGYCFGVPIFVGKEARSAISISIPKSRLLSPQSQESMIASLKDKATEISATLAGVRVRRKG